MADRKPFLSKTPNNEELLELLERTKEYVTTDEELHEQRISFAFGNALNSDGITKDSVRRTSSSIKLRA